MIRLLRAVPGTLAHAPARAGRRGPRVRRAGAGRARRRGARLAAAPPHWPADARSARPLAPPPRKRPRALDALRPLGWPRRCPACRPPSRSGPEHVPVVPARGRLRPAGRRARSRPIGRREYDRAVWLELVHRNRATGTCPSRRCPPTRPSRAAREDAATKRGCAQFYEREGLLSQPGRARPLPRPADARLPGAAALPRRRRRADRPGPAHRERRRLRAGARPGPAVLLRRQRPRPARRDHPRGRPLPAARPVLGEPPPGPPALLRLRRQRGHRLLQRGADAGRRTARRRAAHPDRGAATSCGCARCG